MMKNIIEFIKKYLNRLNSISLKMKLYTVIALAIITLVIFFLNRTLTGSSDGISAPIDLPTEELKIKISAGIDSILSDYGLRKEWIRTSTSDKASDPKEKKQTTQKNKQEQIPKNIWFVKDILTPADLPSIMLVKDLSAFLKNYNLDAIVTEDPKKSNITLDIYSLKDDSKKVISKLNLISSSQIRRNVGDVCIIIDSLEAFTNEDLNKILSSAEKFSVVMPVNFEKSEIQSQIIDSGKDHILKLFVGGEDDIASEFRNDMSDKEWKTKIKSLTIAYNKSSGAVVIDQRRFPELANNIISEFHKNNLDTYKDTLVVLYNNDESGEKKVYDLFSDILAKSAQGNKRLIYFAYFTPYEFSIYEKEVSTLKKKGYKFHSFKEIIRKDKGDAEKNEDEKKDTTKTAKQHTKSGKKAETKK